MLAASSGLIVSMIGRSASRCYCVDLANSSECASLLLSFPRSFSSLLSYSMLCAIVIAPRASRSRLVRVLRAPPNATRRGRGRVPSIISLSGEWQLRLHSRFLSFSLPECAALHQCVCLRSPMLTLLSTACACLHSLHT